MAANWLEQLARASASDERLLRRQLAQRTTAGETGGETRLHAVARALANPMPRRRMLALTGAALASTTLAGWRPARAWGSHCPPARRVNCHAGRLSTCWSPGQRCCANSAGFGGCLPGSCKCCAVSDGNCGVGCCEQDATCCGWTAGAGTGGCTPGQAVLVCCRPPAALCRPRGGLNNRCVSQCPADEIQCGTRCCPAGEECVEATSGDFQCRACSAGETACGGTCCRSGETCIAETQACCPAGRLCAGAADTQCCSPDRPHCCSFTDFPSFCCPEGTTCFHGGGSGGCCPGGRVVCASRGQQACCAPGETCCDGKCCPSGLCVTVDLLPLRRVCLTSPL